MVHGSDDSPASRFNTGSESSRAGEEIDGERMPCSLLQRAPLFEGLIFGCFWVSRERKRH